MNNFDFCGEAQRRFGADEAWEIGGASASNWRRGWPGFRPCCPPPCCPPPCEPSRPCPCPPPCQPEEQHRHPDSMQLQLKTGTTLANHGAVPFDVIVSGEDHAITYVPGSGNLVLNQPGTYFVTWSLNVNQAAGVVNLALTLGGSTEAAVDVYIARGQVCGSALVTVGRLPALLRLTNQTGSAITYDAATTVLANLVIFRLD